MPIDCSRLLPVGGGVCHHTHRVQSLHDVKPSFAALTPYKTTRTANHPAAGGNCRFLIQLRLHGCRRGALQLRSNHVRFAGSERQAWPAAGQEGFRSNIRVASTGAASTRAEAEERYNVRSSGREAAEITRNVSKPEEEYTLISEHRHLSAHHLHGYECAQLCSKTCYTRKPRFAARLRTMPPAARPPSTFEELLAPVGLADKYCAAFEASRIPMQVLFVLAHKSSGITVL